MGGRRCERSVRPRDADVRRVLAHPGGVRPLGPRGLQPVLAQKAGPGGARLQGRQVQDGAQERISPESPHLGHPAGEAGQRPLPGRVRHGPAGTGEELPPFPARAPRPPAGGGLRPRGERRRDDRARHPRAGCIEAGADGAPARRGGGDRCRPRGQGPRCSRAAAQDAGEGRHALHRPDAGRGAPPPAGDPPRAGPRRRLLHSPAPAYRDRAQGGRGPLRLHPRGRLQGPEGPRCLRLRALVARGRAARRQGGSRRERTRRTGPVGSTSGSTNRWSARRWSTCPGRGRPG